MKEKKVASYLAGVCILLFSFPGLCFSDGGNRFWEFATDGPVVSSPALAGGYVYVGSDDTYVYCINAQAGVQEWKFKTDAAVQSSPVVADGCVYIGSNDRRLYCLNALTGEEKWSYATKGFVVTRPAVSGANVYTGSMDRRIYCLDAATGEKLWDTLTGNAIESSPLIIDDDAVFGCNDFKIYRKGRSTWSFDTGAEVKSSPAISGYYLYVGSNDDRLYCLDADTGSLEWDYQTGDDVLSSPAVFGDYVYVGSSDHKIYCFNAKTGNVQWAYETDDAVVSSPAIANSHLYVGCDDARLYCINIETKLLYWTFSTSDAVRSSPAVAGGYVYVGSNDGRIYSITSADNNSMPVIQITSPLDLQTFSKNQEISFSIIALDPEDGELTGSAVVWTSSIDGMIGTGNSCKSTTLSSGTHIISACATDTAGASSARRISITVTTGSAPEVSISSPTDNQTFSKNDSITFSATATDTEDGQLSGSALQWTSSIDGHIGTGETFARDDLTPGTHGITVTATDSDNASAADSVSITISSEVQILPPVVQITSPSDNATFVRGTYIQFSGTARDADNNTLSASSLVWASDIDGNIGTGTSFIRNDLSADNHTITLTATDARGVTGSAQAHITVTGNGDGGGPVICPLTFLAGAEVPLLHELRRYRDTVLSRSSLGRFIIREYYAQGRKVLLGLRKYPSFRKNMIKIFSLLAMTAEKQI